MSDDTGRRIPVFALLGGDFQQGNVRLVQALRKPGFQLRLPQFFQFRPISYKFSTSRQRDIGLPLRVGESDVDVGFVFDFVYFGRTRVGEEPDITVKFDVFVA